MAAKLMQQTGFRRLPDAGLRRHVTCSRSWCSLRAILETYMATLPPRSTVRPAHDEWGVYDPEQAGLSALFARLDSKAASKAAAETAADKLAAQAPSRANPRDSQ